MARHILKYLATVTAIFLTHPGMSALEQSYYAASSRLATGQWVKVKVENDGIQRITHEQLSGWGFSNPEAVAVFGFSGMDIAGDRFNTSMPDDLPQQYSEHIDGALYFYGERDCRITIDSPDALSTVRNYYATYSTYFLTQTDDCSNTFPTPVSYTPGEATRETHLAVDYQEREEYNPGPGGAYFFSRPIGENPEINGVYEFNTPDRAENGTLVLNYMPVARTLRQFTLLPKLPANLIKAGDYNNPPIPAYSESDAGYVICSAMPGSASYYYLKALDDNPKLNIRFTPPSYPEIEWTGLDYAAIIWERNNRLADNGQLTMHFTGMTPETTVTVSETGDNTRVWDITTPLYIKSLATNPGNTTGEISVSPHADGKITLVAFNPGAEHLGAPVFIGKISNTDLHRSTDNPELIIITSQAFIKSANNLADLHRRHQSMSVKVVLDSDIYNEFSSGTPSAIGLHRYIKMMYDRNPSTLKYLLIFGHGTYDNRHLLLPDRNYLPTYQATDSRSNPKPYYTYEPRAFASDVYFGMLDDNFDPGNIAHTTADIGVGRITAANASKAANAVAKIDDYLTSYSKHDNFARAISMAGIGDNNAHSLMAEDVSNTILDNEPAIKLYKGYNSLFSPGNDSDRIKYLRGIFAEGFGYGAFAGHGSFLAIGPPKIITREMASSMTFGNHPVLMLATCHALCIDREDSTVGQSLFDNSDGPIAVISAGRQVYLSRNKPIINALTYHYSTASYTDRLGDVWRRAFNKAITDANDEASGINTLCYNMAGDPALPVDKPQLEISVTSVNGNQASGSEPAKVTPYTTLALEGLITDKGTPFSKFDGTITVTVLDGATRQPTLNKGTGDSNISFETEETVLAKCGGTVNNGKWKISMTIPRPAVADAPSNKVILTAVNDSGTQRAAGTWRGISVGDAARPENVNHDTDGPEIVQMYIDSPEFNDGDGVNSNFIFHAGIAPDQSGIYLADGLIGNRPSLILDGTTDYPIVSRHISMTKEGGAVLSCRFSDIACGEHRLDLSVCDNLGNRSKRSVLFVVTNNNVSGTLTIDDNIITGKATLDIECGNATKVSRLIIEDASGKNIFTCGNPSFPLSWTPGTNIPEGSYRARAFLTRGNKRGVTPDLNLILLNK